MFFSFTPVSDNNGHPSKKSVECKHSTEGAQALETGEVVVTDNPFDLLSFEVWCIVRNMLRKPQKESFTRVSLRAQVANISDKCREGICVSEATRCKHKNENNRRIDGLSSKFIVGQGSTPVSLSAHGQVQRDCEPD